MNLEEWKITQKQVLDYLYPDCDLHNSGFTIYSKKESITNRYEWTEPQKMYKPILYTWGLAGPQGAWFELLVGSHHSKHDIAHAKSYLRQTQDVVSLSVQRIDTLR